MHLSISILLVATVLICAILLWYPGIYFQAMGVSRVLLVLASVDLTIGPFITLIIFNPGKKSLKFDLTVVAVLQFVALVYGADMLFIGRPVYAVYNTGIFDVVSAPEIPAEELKRAPSLSLPLTGPKIVGALVPTDKKERERILFSALNGGPDLAQMPQHYLPYPALAGDVKTRMWSLATLMQRQSKNKLRQTQTLINDAMRDNGLQIADVGFVPMRAKTHDLTVMVRVRDASIVTILPINSWGDQ